MNTIIDKIVHIEMNEVCNPYTTNCIGDHNKSATIRLENLRKYLDALTKIQPDVAWFGEALGHRGGRRSGLPFSDDLHLEVYNQTYGIQAQQACKLPRIGEVTAKMIWEQISNLETPPALWNIFPYHPYKKQHNTNRKPRISELEIVTPLIKDFLEISQSTTLLAIGRTAESWLQRLGYDPFYIRHPSYGGIKSFQTQIRDFYS